MQPVVLAGRPSQGSRGAELRVGEAKRLSFDASWHRPAAAHRASVFRARLGGVELSLAQLQQRRHLAPQRQGFEPATCQVEKGLHKCL